MALKKGMTITEIEDFLLKGDIKDAINFDIVPILHLKIEQGGYFGASRQILCMVDFLGALYCGNNKETRSTKSAVKFIKKIMGSPEIDPKYNENGEILYEIYRHGLVHLYQPKKLILEDKRKVEWCVHKGGRVDNINVKDNEQNKIFIQNARHMNIVKHPKRDSYLLIISLDCLFEDLKKAINKYLELIKSNKKYRRNWEKVASYISDYHPSKKTKNKLKLLKGFKFSLI